VSIGRFTAQLLALSLIQLSLPHDAAFAAGAKSAELKRQVEQYGVGTDLKIKLASGEQLRGSVDSVGSDVFLLSPTGEDAQLEIAYTDLNKVDYPYRSYEAEGTPDPAAARRMVVKLGINEHIMVKTASTETHGFIRDIQDNYFVIQPDGEALTKNVGYGEIQKVHKNLGVGGTIAIVVGIAAVVALILVLSGEDDVDVLPD
jgi:hypothetical protein